MPTTLTTCSSNVVGLGQTSRVPALAALRYQREPPIVGVRLSFTKDAKAKILPTAKAVAEPVARTVAGQSLEREAA
jgi:hypothetical protein